MVFVNIFYQEKSHSPHFSFKLSTNILWFHFEMNDDPNTLGLDFNYVDEEVHINT